MMLAFEAAFLSGCGTICNLTQGVVHPDSEPRVYGGVQRDVEVLDSVVNQAQTNPQARVGNDPRWALILIPLAIGDPILSFVADTLTLPITIPLQRRRIANSENDQASGGNSAAPQSEKLTDREARSDDKSGC
jgi:uncharacterized protein YceK